jgi:hypothetical protein
MDITTIKSRLENRFYRYVVEKIKWLIDWYLTPTFAIFHLYRRK